MSYSQPGPYGQPQPPQSPPQGNPYGQQPGYGYPPQQPYGQAQPYPQPGMPYPPPMPPQRGGKGKAIGIGVAALVLVGAIAGGGYVLLKNRDTVGDDGKRYQLTTPETVVGDYKKGAAEGKEGFDTEELADVRRMGVANPQSVGAGYKSGAGVSTKGLKFNGVWGEVKNPEQVVDRMFISLANAAKKDDDASVTSKVEGSPQKVAPAGLDNAVMKCQYVTYTGSKTVTMPLCIWADHSTVGTVFVVDAARSGLGVKIPFDEAGGLVAKLRTDVRVEVKK
ncbi:hypothetical protein [Streptomyces sp. ISL-11]|uniref:hypothetical protein n=1 Tax=Streptomyces sp. ISL-11 TaxID=2819174 RepID=UPI001BEC67E2|nr:hypothetical protein [Streptomyces sp. ISL-11]MBT2385678.1 hypothetical protein [Streptomyces sp. ISL-11]